MLAQARPSVTPLSAKTQLRDAKKRYEIEDNKRRYQQMFYSGPPIRQVVETAVVAEAPNYMGYPLHEYEDEPPANDYDSTWADECYLEAW